MGIFAFWMSGYLLFVRRLNLLRRDHSDRPKPQPINMKSVLIYLLKCNKLYFHQHIEMDKNVCK